MARRKVCKREQWKQVFHTIEICSYDLYQQLCVVWTKLEKGAKKCNYLSGYNDN